MTRKAAMSDEEFEMATRPPWTAGAGTVTLCDRDHAVMLLPIIPLPPPSIEFRDGGRWFVFNFPRRSDKK